MKKIMFGILAHACECDRNYEIGEYLKDCKWMKSLVDDLVINEISDGARDLIYAN